MDKFTRPHRTVPRWRVTKVSPAANALSKCAPAGSSSKVATTCRMSAIGNVGVRYRSKFFRGGCKSWRLFMTRSRPITSSTCVLQLYTSPTASRGSPVFLSTNSLARLAPQTDKTCILPITIAEDLAPLIDARSNDGQSTACFEQLFLGSLRGHRHYMALTV